MQRNHVPFDELGKDISLLLQTECSHVYHKYCLQMALQNGGRKCPSCLAGIGEPQGKSPSGSMRISIKTNISCEGYDGLHTIQIEYKIYEGTQKVYHDQVGKSFKGVDRRAYLPYNNDGLQLLKRLKYAFLQGLTFRIGTSLTSNKSGDGHLFITRLVIQRMHMVGQIQATLSE